VAQLRHQPECCGFDSQWGIIGIFNLFYLSGGIMSLDSIQALMEMSTRNISLGLKAAGA
jgi:DNA-binding transcriptional regulator GbsR (MarR family)